MSRETYYTLHPLDARLASAEEKVQGRVNPLLPPADHLERTEASGDICVAAARVPAVSRVTNVGGASSLGTGPAKADAARVNWRADERVCYTKQTLVCESATERYIR